MTDKEYREQKARVKKYIDKWFKALGMGWFHIDMTWSRERDEDQPNTAAKTGTYTVSVGRKSYLVWRYKCYN